MRYGSVAMLVLALGAAGCGKTADPGPAPGETPTAAGPTATAEPAIFPSAETTAAATQRAETASPAASPATAPIAPANLRALGTEPFWNVRIDGKTLTYSTPEDQNGRKLPVDRRDTAIGAVFSGELDGASLILTVTKRTCNDGMSDRAYPFAVVLTIGSHRRIGCAS